MRAALRGQGDRGASVGIHGFHDPFRIGMNFCEEAFTSQGDTSF